jgi:uncharacterized protein YndB with AHSA1/START domain
MGKSFKRFIRVFFIGSFVVVVLIAIMIAMSPFHRNAKFPYQVIEHTVEIDASVDEVFQFLGNSDNAKKWSVFVDHITPLNMDHIPDGVVGSIRRCFARRDETGMTWDEEITVCDPNVRRQLTVFNLSGFTMSVDSLATEQLYEEIAPHKTRLTFTVFFKGSEPSNWDLLKTHFSSFQIKEIFEQNMNNIKRIIEE